MIETEARVRRREEILQAAIIEFCENGYDRTRLEEIAHRAGIGKSTIYEYFPSKLELLTATGNFFLDRMLLDIENMLHPNRPLRQALSDYMEYIGNVIGALGTNFLNLVGDQSVTNVIHGLCLRYTRVLSAKLICVLRCAQDAGEISPDINIHTATALILTIPNPPFLKIASQTDFYKSLDQLLDLLFSGLSPR